MSMYKIIALVGESGSGKDSLLQSILAASPKTYHEIISCTTRPPREGEVNGQNYYFFTDKEFSELIAANQMLEYTNFNNWYYGTTLGALSAEKVNIGVFNPAGIYSLLKLSDIDLTVIRIYANEKNRLLRQLNREERPNVEEIIRRYSTDKEDFKKFLEYDFTKVKYLTLYNDTMKDYALNVYKILSLAAS